MKKTIKYLFLATLCLMSIPSFSQLEFNTCSCINGYWDSWGNCSGYRLNGTYNEFIVYHFMNHPSNYVLKVKVIGMPDEISKEEKKRRIKENDWYVYKGIIEYFKSPINGDIKDNLGNWWYRSTASSDNSVSTLIAVTIKIQPYKKNPKTYNIYLDDKNAIGIDLIK